MKKILTITSSSLLLAASANAASLLLAGWDFTNIDDSALTTAANWSDVTASDAVSNGTMYMDGTNGSTAFVNNGALGSVITATANVPQNFTISTRTFNNQLSANPATSQQFQNGFIADASGGIFSFNTSTNGAGIATSFQLSYAAGLENNATDTVSILWEYSFNGTDFTTIGTDIIDSVTSNGGELNVLDVTNASNEIWFRGTLSGITGSNPLQLDNVQIIGDVVPEPSTYAMIAGVAVLGLAYVRRRRRS